MSKKYLVYKICHPKTLSCVWVGMTSNPADRFEKHMFGVDPGIGSTQKTEWIQNLQSEKMKPVFIISSWGSSKAEALIEEARLIGELLNAGHKLFNEIKESDFTPTFRKPVKDNLGRVYRSMLDAEKKTGATRKGILKTINGEWTQANGLQFYWATLQDLTTGEIR